MSNFKFLLLMVIMLAGVQVFPQVADDSWKIYDDTQVGRVDITINPAYLQWLYQNVNSDSEFVAKIHFKNVQKLI